MKRKKKRIKKNKLPCVIDECISQKTEIWKTDKEDSIYSVKELNLLSAKDNKISTALKEKFPQGKIILTANKKPDKQGDYFIVDSKTLLIKFSKDINITDHKQQYFKKFRKMLKNESKHLGSEVTLTKTRIIYKRGNKIKTQKYDNYIM